MTSTTPTRFRVIVLGDHETGDRADLLAETAAEHGAVITEIRTFDPGNAGSCDDLAEEDAVVTALSHAISSKTDIWVPFPMQDLGREQHLRRISLVLQRHGLNLLMGSGLWPCPTEGGISEADFALRREVQAVCDLDHAALAALGFRTLGQEIELALASACTAQPTELQARQTNEHMSEVLDELELEFGPRPVLPAPATAWPERQPHLKRHATWLVSRCRLTQTDAAKFINALGHRTPQGRIWRQATLSALINGHYDRGAAA